MDGLLAYQIAEVQISYKPAIALCDQPKITSSGEAYELLRQRWDDNTIGFVEQSKLLLLNRANACLGIYDLSTGGITGTIVDPRVVFVTALKANASSIIIAHNHPSGSLRPSQADTLLTEKLKEGGKLLDIKLYDHLIITSSGYYSFADDYGL